MPCPVSRYLTLLIVTWFTGQLAAPCWGSAGNEDATLRITVNQLADSEGSVRSAAIEKLATSKDTRILPVLEHYKESSLFLWKDQLVLCPKMEEDEDGNRVAPLQDVLTGKPLTDETGQPRIVPKSELKDVIVRRPDRRALESAIRVHSLFAADLDRRLAAVQQLGQSNNLDFVSSLEEVLKADNPPRIRYAAEEGIWLLKLSDRSADRESLSEAARELNKLHSARGGNKLTTELKRMDQLEADQQEFDQKLRSVYEKEASQIESYQYRVGLAKNIFNGISTGSVLVLIALGLAIIFGQMGVINMAHGELVMLGAYATYVTQLAVGHTPENPINSFFIIALPISFIVAALAGLLIEYLVVRHLYKRPLESLLATWGVGLILIQFIRAGFPWSNAAWAESLPGLLRWGGFGDNIGVNSPTWLVGAVSPITDLALPYNRLFIIVLTMVSVIAIAIMMRYSSLGLRIRATVQNRETASSLGVNTRRTDSYTFAIGSGLAGIAGYALTLIAGVTPDMGQNYIVDSFLVVVTGGVGKLAGSVSAGMGIGVLNKFFEPITFGGAIFSVGLFILFASWIMIALRARRSGQNQLLIALVLPPLFVCRNYQQRGLIKLQIFMIIGLVITLVNPRIGFDHMLVVREDGSALKAGQRIIVADSAGTRKVIQFVESKDPDTAQTSPGVQSVAFEKSPHTPKPELAKRIKTALLKIDLEGVQVKQQQERLILRGSQEILFTNQQRALGLASRTPEGFRATPARVTGQVPTLAYFLAIPVQTIWGKVLILLAVMMFIQWQPAGLFPPRGRLADD